VTLRALLTPLLLAAVLVPAWAGNADAHGTGTLRGEVARQTDPDRLITFAVLESTRKHARMRVAARTERQRRDGSWVEVGYVSATKRNTKSVAAQDPIRCRASGRYRALVTGYAYRKGALEHSPVAYTAVRYFAC
jgi:hypothetical protein